METERKVRLAEVLIGIRDPRQATTVEHERVAAECAAFSGADELVELEARCKARLAWGKARLQWLRQFLVLKHAIASHDAFGRAFGAIDAEQFAAALRRWVAGILPALYEADVVSPDGEGRPHRPRAGALGQTALHLTW